MFITSITSINLVRAFLALALIASASASPLPSPAPAPQDSLALLSTLVGGGDTLNSGGLGLGGLNDALNLGSLLASSPSALESSSSFALSSDADADSTPPHSANLNGIPLALGSTSASSTSSSSSPNTNSGVTDLKHPSESSSPLDLAALPLLGAIAPTTLLGRRAVYASAPASGQGASDAVDPPVPVPAPVALGRAERFRARLMRRASLAVA